MNIASQIRHFLTGIAAIGTFLAAWVVLSPDDVKALNDAGAELVKPAAVILSIIGVALVRMAMTWISLFFRRGAGEVETTKGNGSGGTPLLAWMMIGTAVALWLPSCSASQIAYARAIPIRACVISDHGAVCYSTADGLSAEVDLDSAK